ncbi:ROK family transcriptional regulator, partial [candidate division KSB1 bacterium]|nr:ROK family transcriptional regulator [candidate division KSB1 bacterium]
KEIEMKKIVTGNYRLVRNLNSQIVLNLVRTRGPIYGADLAKITGMRPSTIMNILKTLEKDGFIQKAGTGSSSVQGGRRPMLYEICGDYGYIIGLKIELNELRGVLIDLNSRMIARTLVPLADKQSVPQLVDNISRILDALIIPQNIQPSEILGMGIGISGMVDNKNGIIVKTDLVEENNVPLQELLQQRYGFKIIIENDANAAAMFEKWYNHGKNISNFVYALLIIDQNVFGIGYGIIIEDHIYRGAHMFAGETNPHPVSIRNLLDRVSDKDSAEIILKGENVNKDAVHIDRLIAAAWANDDLARAYFVELAKIIGAELAQAVFILDPELILLGGEVMQVESILLPAIQETMQVRLGGRQPIPLVVSTSEDAVSLGVASLILQDIFQTPEFKPKSLYMA